MPRAMIDPAKRAVTKTFSCYAGEFAALQDMADELKFKTPFDSVRWLARKSVELEAKRLRADFHEPNRKNA